MPRTITALFDRRTDAEAAKERLKDANIDVNNIYVYDKNSAANTEEGNDTYEDRGFWKSVKNAFAPDEDRRVYEEGVNRGGTLLLADVDDEDIDVAVGILESSSPVDLDQRSEEWRASGWDSTASTSRAAGMATTAGMTSSAGMASDRGAMGRDANEAVIPVVEEQLVVGKREVNRGGARVRSYVSEVPVHEQVRLREERINVERRRVDEPLSAGMQGDPFREREIEVTATSEEAVVGKQARVVEEVVVSKTAGERVEEVSDTVRRTEVEVDRDGGLDRDRDGRLDR